MGGEQFHMYFSDNAKSFCISTPKFIPRAYQDMLKAVLQSQNIIIPVTEATDWCAPIVVAPKKINDRIRMYVDLSHLNRYDYVQMLAAKALDLYFNYVTSLVLGHQHLGRSHHLKTPLWN